LAAIPSKSGALRVSIANHALFLFDYDYDFDCDFVKRFRGALLLSIPAAFDSGRAALDHDHFLGANAGLDRQEEA